MPESKDSISPPDAESNVRMFPRASRPAPAHVVDDARLARAYRELETTVSDLRNMVYLLTMLTERVYKCEHPTETMFGSRKFLLDEEHAEVLSFASSQLSNMVRDLHQGYFDMLDGRVPLTR